MVLTKGQIPILAVRVFIFVWGTNSVNTKLRKTVNDGKLNVIWRYCMCCYLVTVMVKLSVSLP